MKSMFEENKAGDSDSGTDSNEIKRAIKEIVSSEAKSDGEELNPFKPITIANRDRLNRH